MVVAVTASLQGEAAAWAADLYSDQARELADVGLFLDALKTRFEDPTRQLRAKAQLVGLQQKGRPVQEYIREFQKVAGRLRSWPDSLLIHHFRTGLDTTIRQACIVRGVVGRLADWYRAVVELDVGLRDHPGRWEDRPCRSQDQPVGGTTQTLPGTVRSRPTFRCFRCNWPGHRAAECGIPKPTGTPTAIGTPGITPKTPAEKSRVAYQLEQSQVQQKPDEASPILQEYEEEEPVEDPMVSEPIVPFTIPITLTSPVTGESMPLSALLDTGCTRCLISKGVVQQMRIRVARLKSPIRFEQVDGSLLGGVPTTLVTEPVRMDIGGHWELIRFIVVPTMSESVILGLAWMDKWTPTIWWAEGSRHLRLAVGPQLRPPDDQTRGKELNSSKLVQEKGEVRYPRVYDDLAAVFSKRECDCLPPHRRTDCAIELAPGAKLPKPRMYPMTFAELQELRKYIDKNLARGFIEPARSRIAAPVIFQGKKDGGLRLCVDFRGLNAVCIDQVYPLPLMKDLLTHLAAGKIFTKLDLREAYYRVRIKEGDEWKTAFNCPLGSYQFKVMPFGLQGAPAVFMQLINEVLHDHLYRGVLVYLDDILIYSQTLEEHVQLVRTVLRKLLDANLYCKLLKCEFHKTRIDYLGFRVSAIGIEMDPSKVHSVLEWQAPRTRHQLQRFLGFANFYRQFIPSFADMALPLTQLLRTKTTTGKPHPKQALDWTVDCQWAFESLKRLFAKEPVLLHPDPSRPYVVQADASDVAVGALLMQRNGQGELQPCAYTSKKFTDPERRWAVWEKEAFAIKWALSTWRHLLEGAQHPFEVWTDHRNLMVLQTPRRLAPKHVRWAQYFQRFRFSLKVVPGGKNFLADALSRLPQYDSKKEQVIQTIVPICSMDPAQTEGCAKVVTLEEELQSVLLTDPWLQANPGLLTHRDGLAWYRNRLYIPSELRHRVFHQCHDSKVAGHFGFVKTLHLARRRFWWPSLRKDIERYVKECHICAQAKVVPKRPMGLLQSVSNPVRPWQDIGMDFLVELPNVRGYTVIWTVVDLFSKQAHFVPCKGLPSARKLAKLFVQHIYRLHGAPRRIISDRGVQFTARFWRQFLVSIGTTQGLSSAYHPCTNGAAERANAAISRYLRSYISYQQSDWIDFVPFAELAYNNAVHKSTGLTPFQIVYGYDPVTLPGGEAPGDLNLQPGDWMSRAGQVWGTVKKALQQAERIAKEQADKGRRLPMQLRVGDRVYLSTKYVKLQVPCKKLAPKYIGPFHIVRIINPVTVQLQLPELLGKIHPVFHVSLLKPVEGDTHNKPPPGPIAPGRYEVQDILDSRWRRGTLYYLVLWKGYPLSEASWVREEDVFAPALTRRYHRMWPHKLRGRGIGDSPTMAR
ncbi:hypothetical protein NXF25_020642 [Crotalus adamanteus]|uniref:Gypsy retrotransposon integrase-like protein 1 n=1 Tax=Crotalus adamanteus TaxID=8729 RepID=A0AAW1B6M3_CROAD